MKIGVLSDTHGNTMMMNEALRIMAEDYEVDAVIHLGDDMSDMSNIDLHGKPFYAVPGMYEAMWNDGNTPHRRIVEFGGLKFLLSHSPHSEPHDAPIDIKPETARARYGIDVLLYGHTHRYAAFKNGDGVITINPGHLKSEMDRGNPASFAIIDIDSGEIHVEIMGMDGGILLKGTFDIRVENGEIL